MVEGGPDREPSARPAEDASRWTIDWGNVIPLLLVVAIVVVAWRWIDGATTASQADEASDELGTTTTSVLSGPADRAAVATLPRGSTATVPSRPAGTPSTSSTIEPDRRVLIRGAIKPCRYGSECLVASFTIEGFEEHPGRFVCVYPNSRSDFGFGSNGVDDACLTADDGDTITIEVDGVQSATISEQDLDGTSPPD